MLKLIRICIRCSLVHIHSEDIIINTDEVARVDIDYTLGTIKLKNGESIDIPLATNLLMKPFMEFMVNDERIFRTYNLHSIKRAIASHCDDYSHIEPVYSEGFDGFRKSLPEMTLDHVIWYSKLLKGEGFVDWESPSNLERSDDEYYGRDIRLMKSIHKFSSDSRMQNLYSDIKNKFNNLDGLLYDINILGEHDAIEKLNKTYRNEVKEILEQLKEEKSK